MSITIKDIAKEMGISVSTVSKALNDRSDISLKVKEKVRSTSKKMGYKKNILASRLVNMKSNTLGVFIFSRSKIKNTESSAFKYLNVMLDETKKQGYDIVLFSSDTRLKSTKSYVDLCTERQVEGAVFIGFEIGDPHLQELMESDLPVVLIEKITSGNRISCITTDNKKGIRLGLQYLFELGHERIAYVKGHDKAEVSHIRFETYKKLMEEKGFFNENLIFEGDFSLDSGYKVGLEIAGLDQLPTAVFAANDLMAIGLIRALHEQGISVPDDISVMGFDNFEISKFVRPPLTSISQDFTEIAVRAINLLLDMINNETKPRDVFLDPELIVRESCKRNKELS